MTVDSGASLSASTTYVGDLGTGKLVVNGTSTLSSSVYLGYSGGASGEMDVNGTVTAGAASAAFYVGGSNPNAGTGLLNVGASGSLTIKGTQNASLFSVGYYPGSTGTVNEAGNVTSSCGLSVDRGAYYLTGEGADHVELGREHRLGRDGNLHAERQLDESGHRSDGRLFDRYGHLQSPERDLEYLQA